MTDGIISGEKLAKEFKEHSVAEFFKRNRQMLGLYGKVRTLTTVVHEYLTNSLDACEEANILPEISVKLEELNKHHYLLTVKDNGPGLTEDTVGKALGQLLAGTKFHRLIQMRGQQGIGACMDGSTLINFSDGRILPIKEICEENLVGEKVFSLDLNDMKIKPQEISKCWIVENPQLIEIQTKYGRTIKLTPENPVLCLGEKGIEWKQAYKLTKNDFIAIPTNVSVKDREESSENYLIDYFDWNKMQVDNPEFVEKQINKLAEKFGSLKRASKKLGISYNQLRNWKRKMKNGNPRGRPTLNKLLKLCKANELTEKQVFESISRIGRNGNYINIPLHLNKDLCWLVGAIAGDGHIGSKADKKWGTNIFFHNKNHQLIKKSKRILKKHFGIQSREYTDKKGSIALECSSTTLATLLNKLGVPSGYKCDKIDLSNEILKNKKWALATIQGLFDTDGSAVTGKEEIALSSKSKKILEKVNTYLISMGINGRLSNKSKKGVYRYAVSGKKNLELFKKHINFFHPEKKQKLKKIIKSIPRAQTKGIPLTKNRVKKMLKEANISINENLPTGIYSGLYDGFSRESLMHALKYLKSKGFSNQKTKALEKLALADIIFVKPKSIQLKQNNERFVYDLEIEGKHNFLANNIVAHNSGCTMLSQMTTGKSVKVITGTDKGKALACEITIDPKKNKPKIDNLRKLKKKFRGLMVQAEFKEVLYRESKRGPLEYVRRTAIANPHAKITFVSPKGEKTVFNRSVSYIPKQPKPMKPHPNGVTVDEVLTMGKSTKARKVSSFLKSDFERVGSTSVNKIQKEVDFDLNKDPQQLSWSEAEQLVDAFKKVDFIAPSTDGLRPIGGKRIKKSLDNIVEPEFVYTITRSPKVYAGGYPFQIEIGIAYGGNAGRGSGGEEDGATERMMSGETEAKVEIMRFANRAPLLFDSGNCAITKAVHSVDWKRYGIKDLKTVPLTIFVNFTSVHVPYTGAGKQAITDEKEVMEELRLAIMQCGRKTSRYIKAKRREIENQMKRDMFYKYIPEVAGALSNVTKANKDVLVKNMEKLVLEKLNLKKPGEENEEEDEKKKGKKKGKKKKK